MWMQHLLLLNLAAVSHDCCLQSPGSMSEDEGPRRLHPPPVHQAAMKPWVGGVGAEIGPEKEKGLMIREGELMHDETAAILLH